MNVTTGVPVAQAKPFDSEEYWRKRYRKGGTSGSGSYGRLAVYKAHVINELVHRLSIDSVVEHGSGDGNQASLFDLPVYTGLDVSKRVVNACRDRFSDRPGWQFMTTDSDASAQLEPHDLSMSLDVIYHLVEDAVFEVYMARLFDLARDYVLIYATDHDARAAGQHVRHRAYSEWISTNRPDWIEAETLAQPFPRLENNSPDDTALAFFRLYRRAT